MATIRESLQADIAAAEASLADKRQKLADLEAQAASVLEQDIDAVKSWFVALRQHLGF